MASKLNFTKSQVSNGITKIATKPQNLGQTNYGKVDSFRKDSKPQPWQPNNLEPCQPIIKTKCKKQSLTANLTKSTKINKSNAANQSTPNLKLTTMEKSKFTNRPISSGTTSKRSAVTTTKTYQNSNTTVNKPSTRLTQSARSNPSLLSPSSTSSSAWKSPFKTFVTNGIHRARTHYGCQSPEFSYHLSPDELKFVNTLKSPMKPAPEQERQLLINGQRIEYLSQRYEHSPRNKYNYPEATSWRIGWLQQQPLSSSQGLRN